MWIYNLFLATIRAKELPMSKNVLILCTGNSCRSIIAEALINKHLEGINAYSSGVKPSGRVNPNAKKVLQNHGAWREEYHSKTLDTLEGIAFDLVVTVCDHAKETCPVFSKPTPKVHIGFEDPDGKAFEAFEKTYDEIKEELLPRIKAIFSGEVEHLDESDTICYCIGVDKATINSVIEQGATTLKMIREATKACTGSSCKTSNPQGRCCSQEINRLIQLKEKDMQEKNMQKNVFKTNEGVKINFTGVVQKQQIVKMVQNCATGACECMSDETKKKISNMQVEGVDGNVELKLDGDVTKEEIEKALAKSKVLNP
jgi:arsenate reductase